MWRQLGIYPVPGEGDGEPLDGADPDLEGLEGDEGDEGEGSGEAAQGAQGAAAGTPDWKAEVEALRTAQNDQNVRMAAAVAEIMRSIRGISLQPVTAPVSMAKSEEEARIEAYRLALTSTPELLPGLMREEAQKAVGANQQAMEQRLASMLAERDASAVLRQRLQTDWQEEIADPQSPILKATPDARKLLRTYLDPKFQGTDVEDQLAFLLAAGQNPRAVARRQSASMKAAAERKAAARQRAAAMGGGSSDRGAQAPTVTEEDLAVAKKMQINLEDPKQRDKFLAYKGFETLNALGMGQKVGR